MLESEQQMEEINMFRNMRRQERELSFEESEDILKKELLVKVKTL